MHQDNFYWNLKKPNSFTMWIAIDKAKKNNGAVEYLAGSHKKLYAHSPSYAPGSSQMVKKLTSLKKKFKTKIFSLEPGDCLIHHSQIVHGSKKNISNFSRRGFTIQITPKNVKVDTKRFKKYQKSLAQQIKMRKIRIMVPGNEIINFKELNEIKKFLLKVMEFYLHMVLMKEEEKFLE